MLVATQKITGLQQQVLHAICGYVSTNTLTWRGHIIHRFGKEGVFVHQRKHSYVAVPLGGLILWAPISTQIRVRRYINEVVWDFEEWCQLSLCSFWLLGLPAKIMYQRGDTADIVIHIGNVYCSPPLYPL